MSVVEKSVAAAQSVAREHGVACGEAVRISGGSNALVHLRPAPVVARVMTVTALLHDDPQEWLGREVAVGAFLAPTGLAVAPTALLPPGPHERDGLWMTMWEYVPHDRDGPPPAPAELGRSLRALHDALAGFTGELPPLSGIRDWLEGLLGGLGRSPDLDRVRDRMAAVTPAAFESSLPAQALHGDVSIGNLLRTDGGLLWNDFEDVCAGPVGWDVAGLVASARVRGHDAAFTDAILAAYGEVDGLPAFLEAHALYEVIWRSHVRAPAAAGRPARR